MNSKCVPEGLSKPMEKDCSLLNKLARYLIHSPELVLESSFREPADEGEVLYTDTEPNRGFASPFIVGACFTHRGRVVKTWSATQGRFARSSAEAEVHAIVPAHREGLRVARLMSRTCFGQYSLRYVVGLWRHRPKGRWCYEACRNSGYVDLLICRRL